MDTLNKIISLMKQKKISNTSLARYLNISVSQISNWKSGNNTSYLKYISQIAEFLEVSTDYLLGKDDNIKVYDEHDNIVVIDDETRDIIDSLRTKPEMKILFSVSKKATKEDILKAVKIIEALKDDK